MIKRAGKVINSKELVDQYLSWVKAMHDEYDEEVEFLDTSPTYICDQPNIHELLGLTKDRHHECKGIFYCKLYFFYFYCKLYFALCSEFFANMIRHD